MAGESPEPQTREAGYQTAGGSGAAGRNQLHGSAAIGSNRVERNCQERVIVEKSVAGADDSFAVAHRIPRQAKARRNVVVVPGNAFDNAERFFSGGVDRGSGGKKRRDFHVVASAIVQGQLWSDSPGILRKEAERQIVERLVGLPDALNVGSGNAQAIGLQAQSRRAKRSCLRRVKDWNAVRQAKGGGRESAEVDVATKVQLENLLFRGTKLNEVEVAAEFESVVSAGDGAIVRELKRRSMRSTVE